MEKENKEYIYLEKDASEGKVLIDINNVNGEDIIYLFLTMIGLAIIKKEELENKRGNKE